MVPLDMCLLSHFSIRADEAKRAYNAFADNPYVESDPLKKRGEGFSL